MHENSTSVWVPNHMILTVRTQLCNIAHFPLARSVVMSNYWLTEDSLFSKIAGYTMLNKSTSGQQ